VGFPNPDSPTPDGWEIPGSCPDNSLAAPLGRWSTAPVIPDEAVRDMVSREWRLTGFEILPHHGGMNSATWWVDVDGTRRFVAKSVPPTTRDGFLGGLAVAGLVESGGVPAGAPVPASSGLTASLPDGSPVALLRYVEGDELTSDDGTMVGTTLGRVHRILAGAHVDGERRCTASRSAPRTWPYATGSGRRSPRPCVTSTPAG